MDLIKQNNKLPIRMEDLTRFILIGREKLVSVRAEIRAIDKIGLAQEVKEQKQNEAQDLAGALLDAETKIGEILKSRSTSTFKKGGEKNLPLGINKFQSSQFQLMAKNIDIVERVKAEAIGNDDLPTRTEVLRQIKEIEREENIIKQKDIIESGINTPKGKYDLIVFDPPWDYGVKYNPETRRVANPYPEMSNEEIKAIDIPANKDCVLWFWTTHKFIWNAKEIMDNWGFEYKGILVWNKEKMGMGSWFRMQCEFCLLGVKGKPLWNINNLRDIISEPRREHSRKPEGFYDMIDNNFVGKKLDYFSRQKRKGWEVFGNDINKYVGK